MKRLTLERLHELLEYNPHTGLFTWKVDKYRSKKGAVAGTSHYGNRVMITLDGETHYAHRLAWLYVYGEWPSGIVDHINRNGEDNRIENLRDTDRKTNARNTLKPRKHSLLGVVGVRWRKDRNKFEARITVNKKTKGLGYFSSLEEASKAYLLAKERLHGVV